MRPWTVALLTLLALSGCLQGGTNQDPVQEEDPVVSDETPPVTERPTPGPDEAPPEQDGEGERPADPLRPACPDGSEGDPHDCASRFGLPGQDQGEPDVAVDPNDPNRLLVAFQQKSAGDDGPWPMQFYRSDDRGASWVRLADPWPPQDPHADPLVAFLPDGGLLAVSVAVQPAPDGLRLDVWVARSEDDGATWDAAPLTDDGDNDRPGLAVRDDGTVAILWQQAKTPNLEPYVPLLTHAVSTDHGRTWGKEATLVEDCQVNSAPVFDATGFGFACQTGVDAPCRTPWFHADGTGSGLAQVRGCVRQEPCNNSWAAGDGVRLASSCWAPRATFQTSDDGGRTWVDHGPLVDLVPGLDPTHSTPHRISQDGAGWHVVMASMNVLADPAEMLGDFGASHVYLSYEMEGRATVLWDGPVAGSVHKGEYYGAASTRDGGAVAWVDGEHRVRVLPLLD